MDDSTSKFISSIGQGTKGKKAVVGKYGLSKLSLNIEAARATESAPTTPVENTLNIGYECVYFDGRGQTKRRREESSSPGRTAETGIDQAEGVRSRMAERLLNLHDQLDKCSKLLVDLVRANSNTKVEIKSGISTLRSIASQVTTAEMRTAVEGLTGAAVTTGPSIRVMVDADSQTGESIGSRVHSQKETQTDDSAVPIPELTREDGLGDIRRDIRAIQVQLESLASGKGPRAKEGAAKKLGSRGTNNVPPTKALERLEEQEAGAETSDPAGSLAAAATAARTEGE